MRKFHRYLAVIAVFFGLYVAATGTFLQLIDLKTLLGHAPASNPDLRAIREGRNGPPNFVVATDADFTAKPLPGDFDLGAALRVVVPAARAAAPGAPFRFLEMRMIGDRPVAEVDAAGKLLRIDARSGAVLVGLDTAPKVALPPAGNQRAFRNTIKNIHRWLAFGDIAVAIFFLLGLMMCAMVVTGLVLYYQLLRQRARVRRKSLFWPAGGWWRAAHRATAVIASLFLIVVVFSGTLLAFGDLSVAVYRIANHGQRPGMTADVSAPLSDAELPTMLAATLKAYRADGPGLPLRVVRLRFFAGMPQGVVVTGGEDARQIAYDTRSGAMASLSGPDYPATGQPFGWQEDQIVKGIHRGDFIGLTGRWMSLLTGLALLFMTLSGAAMYLELWNKRRRAGRPRPVLALTVSGMGGRISVKARQIGDDGVELVVGHLRAEADHLFDGVGPFVLRSPLAGHLGGDVAGGAGLRDQRLFGRVGEVAAGLAGRLGHGRCGQQQEGDGRHAGRAGPHGPTGRA